MIFSDETKVNRWGSDGRQYVWKERGAPTTDRLIDPTIKHGGGSLMMWGCFLWQGVGYATKIEGTLNSDFYKEIMDDELMETLKWYELDVNDVVFQHDNAPCHKANRVLDWFEEKGMVVLDWPSNSPDLNPIEHLWEYLKRQINAYTTKTKSIHELWERLEEEWDAIPVEYCQTLISSMPDRIKAVIKARGGSTDY